LPSARPSGPARSKADLARHPALPFYRAMLVQSGFAEEIAAYDRASAPGAVPDRLAAALGAIGDFRAIADFVAAHRAAGVTLPAIRPIPFPAPPHYVPTLEPPPPSRS